MSGYHKPVLLEESISQLITNPSGVYADLTFGGGGHSAAILSRLDEGGHLIAFDRDADALANAPQDPRFTLIHNNFRFIHNYALLMEAESAEKDEETEGDEERGNATGTGMAEAAMKSGAAEETEEGKERGNATGTEKAEATEASSEACKSSHVATAGGDESQLRDGAVFDGILADLGVSSHQFDTAERGFSFRYDAPLDMRMNTEGGKTAADVVNGYGEADLERVFRVYGEIDNARRLASLIVAARKAQEITTTGELCQAIQEATPKTMEHKYLAKVYQALRIEVNEEMRSLEKMLGGAARSLKDGGRLVVITYHSLEDRMVKNFIRTGNVEGHEEKDFFGNTAAPLRAVVRKPIVPQEEEIAANTRARSAKMRVAEKTAAKAAGRAAS